MTELIARAEILKKLPKSKYSPGSVERIYEYNDKCSRHEYGALPTIIKPDPIELKKKKGLN